MIRSSAILLFLTFASLLAIPSAEAGTGSRCYGDCGNDDAVSVDELITIVTIALGERDLEACKAGDSDDDGQIQVHDIIRSVNSALEGCIDPPFKNRIAHPFEPYAAFSNTSGGPSWIKFTIKVDQPNVVYFQNSGQVPFHHDFVSASLSGYLGWTPAEIDAVSLRAEGQELVFGAVLYSPALPHEIAIQLVRQDAYSVAEVTRYFDSVRAAIDAEQTVPVFYFPTFEQQASASDNRDALHEAGIVLGSTARWLNGDACYNFGWAHGRLVFIPGADIEDAYAEGRLKPTDILLTDGVPAEIPFVAGVLSLAASTPSSHVAILASDWEIPFAFLAQQENAELAQELVGRNVIVRATTLQPRIFTGAEVDTAVCQVRIVDVTDRLSEAVVSHLQGLKQAPDLQLRPFVRSGTYAAQVSPATPDDIVRIGGKAANYGFLLRAIPNNARLAIAFTFDLWDDYLDQAIDGGATLRERIAELLAPFPTYPPSDFSALFEALDQIRDLIDDEGDFTAAQRSAIVAALAPFDPLQPIRFRSSTNVEDSDVFTGAGLYESESGCLADDTDDDEAGPSHCDASRPGERGVFRALRKVFESFYNDNAFLERLRHRVDESQVGMAVLVNHTFVDASELANGVATLRVNGPSNAFATIVSQPGAFSVTNPEDAGLPEVVEAYIFSAGSTFVTQRQSSDRLPLGSSVLEMPNEYTFLSSLLVEVAEDFGQFHGETSFDIEFEWKKVVGEGLEIKQVRRIPGVTAGETQPVLIDEPSIGLCTFQGEYADILANYRLKTRWQTTFASGPVGDSSLYSDASHTYVLGSEVRQLTGAPASWPQATHATYQPDTPGVLGFRHSWQVGEGAARRTMKLSTEVPTAIGPNNLPIVFPSDLGLLLDAEYSSAVPYRDFDGVVRTRSEEQVRLVVCPDGEPLTAKHLLQERSAAQEGLSVDIGFYWPPVPTGAVAGYTAPLNRWAGTTISGIGAEAVELTGYFSQTYRPEHHNFSEGFVFDPHLEEGIDAAILAAWDAADIQALVLPPGFDEGAAPFLVLTRSGELRER